ncbi:MAG: hypothetical protein CM15mP23_22120 [Cryomorphaceae bacterium]|nr:MAG: hypothetical protein CM15mP23_22120 [Cryomorphaceae bacterium]
MGCLATLSTPDMSEEKRYSIHRYVEEFFTPRIDAALSVDDSPEAGFYPPEGSVFNTDSSVVTLPSVTQNSDYNESISFYATEEISIPGVGSFGFVFCKYYSVSTPTGMSYSCDPEGCNLGQMLGDMLL